MDDLTKSCIFICTWALIFGIGLVIAGVLSKPIGIIIMVTSTAVMMIRLRADVEIESERRRRKRYEEYVMNEYRKALEDRDDR